MVQEGASQYPILDPESQTLERGSKDPLYVQLKVYEGPLDLLLDLIKKHEMDIYDIPIHEITRQYLDYLEKMKELNLEIAGEFLVMAATLVYIKSKMLLPQPDPETPEEEGEDPRQELVRKLLEYQAFREAAKELGILAAEEAKVFTRQIADYYLAELSQEEPFVDTFSADLFDLMQAFQQVLQRAAKESLHEVYEEVISIEEKMAEIRSRLLEEGSFTFSSLFSEHWTRNEFIATFLALLEIVRTRFARVRQKEMFGEIWIEKVS